MTGPRENVGVQGAVRRIRNRVPLRRNTSEIDTQYCGTVITVLYSGGTEYQKNFITSWCFSEKTISTWGKAWRSFSARMGMVGFSVWK